MKKKLCCLLTVVLFLFSISSAFAAGYTLPFKMQRQLEVGSGLKGSFVVTAEGEKFNTPFMNQITDAEFDIRGIVSGKDLHYYVFQNRIWEISLFLNLHYYFENDYYF